MLLKNCIYGLIFLISLSSLILLLFSIESKNKHVCRIIKIIDIVYIFYLICIIFIKEGLALAYQLNILFYEGLGVVALLLLIISIIICSVKRKNLNIDIKQKKANVVMLILLVIPIISFMSMYFREKYLINNSDLILVYYSGGNGGLGDGVNFAYAINDDYCKEISIGADINGYDMKKFLPKTFSKVNTEYIQALKTAYEVKYNNKEGTILIYKNEKCIHKKKINSQYFNVDLKSIFVKEVVI